MKYLLVASLLVSASALSIRSADVAKVRTEKFGIAYYTTFISKVVVVDCHD